MKFPDLISQISKIDEVAQLAAGRTLQQILSLRSWLIGASIVEFEQAGEDRAQYGQRLMHTLAQALGKVGCQGLSASNLKNFRQLALAYPGLDAINLGRRLSVPVEGDRVGEFARRLANLYRTLAESPAAQLRDPYVLEFLGIEQRGVMAESDLEGALVDRAESAVA